MVPPCRSCTGRLADWYSKWPAGPAETRVEIEHGGWDRLGQSAEHWRDRNRIGWETLLPYFLAAIEKGDR
jgi:hypothetical protein